MRGRTCIAAIAALSSACTSGSRIALPDVGDVSTLLVIFEQNESIDVRATRRVDAEILFELPNPSREEGTVTILAYPPTLAEPNPSPPPRSRVGSAMAAQPSRPSGRRYRAWRITKQPWSPVPSRFRRRAAAA